MSVTDAFRADAWSPESDLYLVLLTIEHPDLDPPIHVVNNTVNVISNGITYVAFPFEIALPESPENGPPRAELTISNVSREIGQAIRQVSSPPAVSIQVIRQETPDVVEASHQNMKLTGVTYDVQQVSGQLVREDFVTEPYPATTYSPAEFKGLIQ